MPRVTRRTALIGGVAAVGAPAIVQAQSIGSGPRVSVVGAGALGAWTAEHLRRAGAKVRLWDAWGPAHSRASSGGESRMTRGAYGRDEVYTRMALTSLAEWKGLSNAADLPLLHQCGVLFFFAKQEPYLTESLAVHRRLKLPTELLDQGQMRRRFPQIEYSGIEVGLFEPEFGALMARRAIQTLVDQYVRKGGTYERAAVVPPAETGNRLRQIRTAAGQVNEADAFVFACGPWLPKIFPKTLGRRIFPTRQEVFFFAPRAGDRSFEPARFPGWADFNEGDIYYGFPDLEGRGFKIAHDAHGPPIDPDGGDRGISSQGLADVRKYMERRFPTLAGRPMTEARVCQYENSANGDLLIDHHPALKNVLLIGAGSGHGFKHGPAVGRYATQLLMGDTLTTEQRFSLATKGERQQRSVR